MSDVIDRRSRSAEPARSGDTSGRENPSATRDNAAHESDDQSPPKPSPFKRPAVLIALIVGAVLVLIGAEIWASNWWTYGRFIQSTNDAYLKAD